jgi:hypothetical protein
MEQHPTTDNLPAALTREIGRVVVSYARLEWLLRQLLYAVLGVTQTEGRIAVGEPRATDRFDRICEILAFKAMATDDDLKAIRDAIEACQTQRNQLAHATHPELREVWARSAIGIRCAGYPEK